MRNSLNKLLLVWAAVSVLSASAAVRPPLVRNYFTTNRSPTTFTGAFTGDGSGLTNLNVSPGQPASAALTNYSHFPVPDGIAIQDFAMTNSGGVGWDGAGVTTGAVTYPSVPAPCGGTQTCLRITGSGEYVRRLAFSNNWMRLRILLLARVPTNGPAGGAKFGITNISLFFGLCSGTNATWAASNTANAVGITVGCQVANAVLVSTNTVPRAMEMKTYGTSLRFASRTNGVITDRTSGSGSGCGWIAADAPFWSFLAVDVDKPFDSRTNAAGGTYSLWCTAVDRADIPKAWSYHNLLASAYSYASASSPTLDQNAGAWQSVSYTYSEGSTAFDTFNLYWANTNNVPLEIGGILVHRYYYMSADK